jgi:hypothetical protein
VLKVLPDQEVHKD